MALLRFHHGATVAVSVTSPATPTLPDDLYLLLVGRAVVTDEPNLPLLGASRLAAVGAAGAAADGILYGTARATAILDVVLGELLLAAGGGCRTRHGLTICLMLSGNIHYLEGRPQHSRLLPPRSTTPLPHSIPFVLQTFCSCISTTILMRKALNG